MKKLTYLLIIISVFQIQAQEWSQTQKIVATDRSAYGYFGESVDLDADRAIIGTSATSGDINQNYVGTAYILEKDDNSYNEVQILFASDAKPADNFGNAVIIRGDFAYVAAIHEGSFDSFYTGAVYVFERDINGVWNEIQKITPSDRDLYQKFGNAIAIEDDTLVVGAFDSNQGDGAVLIYERDSNGIWNETQIIVPTDLQDYDAFGTSVSIDGDNLLIGASKESLQYPDKYGAAYIFTKNNSGIWEEYQKLTPSIRFENANFGYSASLKGDYAVIGSYSESDIANAEFNYGAAYIFVKDENDNWVEHQKLQASDAFTDDYFGNDVKISGDNIIIAAYNKTVYSDNVVYYTYAGAVYSFTRNNSNLWEEVEIIVPSPRHDSAHFGSSIAIDDSEILIGAWRESRDGNEENYLVGSGACYFYENSTLSVEINNISKPVLFPNPSIEFIQITNLNIDDKYTIYNILGATVMTGSYHNQINIRNLTPGMYVLKTENNIVLKFLKK